MSCVRHAGLAQLLRLVLPLICGLVLQGCGGGAATVVNTASPGTSSSTPVTPVAPANHAPTVSGTPATAVDSGQAYTFTPAASDPDGDGLSFSIENKPSWATFSSTTGRLTGTPSSAGTYANVIISVSDGTASAALPAFSIVVSTPATSPSPSPSPGTGTATLSWTPPTARSDGSVLTNLAGYRIRYGTSPGELANVIEITNPGLATYVVENLSPGTYYFAVSAYDGDGEESDPSTPVSKTIG
jgi:hypothetical protein